MPRFRQPLNPAPDLPAHKLFPRFQHGSSVTSPESCRPWAPEPEIARRGDAVVRGYSSRCWWGALGGPEGTQATNQTLLPCETRQGVWGSPLMSAGNFATGQQGLASQHTSPVPITATSCANWVGSRGPDRSSSSASNQPSWHLRICCPFFPSAAHFPPSTAHFPPPLPIFPLATWLFSLHPSTQPGQRAGRQSTADCEMGGNLQGPRCSSHPVRACWCPKASQDLDPPIPHQAGLSDPSPAPAVPSNWHQHAARKWSGPNPSLVEPR